MPNSLQKMRCNLKKIGESSGNRASSANVPVAAVAWRSLLAHNARLLSIFSSPIAVNAHRWALFRHLQDDLASGALMSSEDYDGVFDLNLLRYFKPRSFMEPAHCSWSRQDEEFLLDWTADIEKVSEREWDESKKKRIISHVRSCVFMALALAMNLGPSGLMKWFIASYYLVDHSDEMESMNMTSSPFGN